MTKEEIIRELEEKLLSSQKDMPAHYVHLVTDNFWDLIYYDA